MLLPETIKNIESDLCLSSNEIDEMDLEEIAEHIKKQTGVEFDNYPKPSPFSQMAESVYYFYNRFISHIDIERKIKHLFKKYKI